MPTMSMYRPEFNLKRYSARIAVVTPSDAARWVEVLSRHPAERTPAEIE